MKPAFQLLAERVAPLTPEWASGITGIPAPTIRRIAHEIGVAARDNKIELPIAWTDWWGRKHDTVTGNAVAFHAMRGLAAHSNGFQTIRTLAILMSLLGTIDRPGGFRHRAPYPRAVPPNARPPKGPQAVKPNTPLDGAPLGWPEGPDDLFVDEHGEPVRIDKGFSWEHPLSAHGLMHNVITNAWRGDPYPIDTLFLFMANMAWNSTMNTSAVRGMLTDRDERGEYRIPFLVVCDAFQSETTAFADLILPDSTYLERHDAMSLLDRPISEFEGPVDSVRVPVVPPTGDCKPFQEVLIELASRLGFPAFVNADGTRKYRDYPDFVVRYETAPGSGIGFLAGWRGKDGEKSMRGEPNPKQWEMYAQNNCVFQYHLPPGLQYMRNWNRDYLSWARDMGLRRDFDPIVIHLYSEFLQRFRLAAQGKRPGRAAARAPARARRRVLRPAAVLVRAARVAADRRRTLSAARGDAAADGDVPLVGLAERVAAPDPHPQLPDGEHAHRAGRRHRRRRLDVGRVAVGQGALPVPAHRGRRAGNGVDLERDRQGGRRVEPRPRRQRVAAGFPAQPPDRRGAAGARRDAADLELRPRDRTGGVVRRAGADLARRRRRAGRSPRRSSRRCRRCPGRSAASASWIAYFAGDRTPPR